jgi:hypothetical protein
MDEPLDVEELVLVGAEVYVGLPVGGRDATKSKSEGAGALNVSSVGIEQFRPVSAGLLQQLHSPVLLLYTMSGSPRSAGVHRVSNILVLSNLDGRSEKVDVPQRCGHVAACRVGSVHPAE